MSGLLRSGLAYAAAPAWTDFGLRYRMHVDESGNHHVTPEGLRGTCRYLGITGVVTESHTYRHRIQPALDLIRRRHFPCDPDEPLIFHRDDMVKKRGAFGVLRDDKRREQFDAAILDFFARQSFHLISVVIDKYEHLRAYREKAYHPYDYAFGALMERYVMFLNRRHATGDVVAESRAKREDNVLRTAWEKFFDRGTKHLSSADVQRALTSQQLKLKPKSACIDGLQLADLLAYPCAWDVLVSYAAEPDFNDPFSPLVAKAVAQKYDRHPNTGKVAGYGKYLLLPPAARC